MFSVLDYALDLWRRGLSVIPVPRADGSYDGKTPTIRWREFQNHSPTESEMKKFFAGKDRNIAVITGAISCIVVVDVDSTDALHWIHRTLPYTPWQTRTASGFHLWYQHPGVPVPNRSRLQTEQGKLPIDVRGDGGYVIAPGSVHASGAAYEFAGDWRVPCKRLPRFWPAWLQRPERRRSSSSSSPSRALSAPRAEVIERASRYLAAIPLPEIGCGSDTETFYAAARIVRGFRIDEATAIELIWQWAGGRPGWTREWIARKVQHALRYGTEPMGALLHA